MTRDPETLANYLAMATGFENTANWRAVTPHGDSWVCTDNQSGTSTYHDDMYEALDAATDGGPGRADPREALGWETTVRLEVSTLRKGHPGGVCTAIINKLPDGIDDHRGLYAAARALIDRADRLRALDDEEPSRHAEPERPQKEGPMPAGEREDLEMEW